MEYHTKKTCSAYGGGLLVYRILMFLLCSYAAVFYISCDMNVWKLLYEITCFLYTQLN
jgi:hypothetical protein